MNIGELAQRTKTTARMIRHYDANGLLRSKRRANGYRDYDEAAVNTVIRIRWLISGGLTLRTIRQILPCVVGTKPKVILCDRTRSILNKEVARIQADLDDLKRSQRILQRALGGELTR
jgi:DNA-binding transcriptional MerR regulator